MSGRRTPGVHQKTLLRECFAKMGFVCIALHGGRYQRSGIPDLMVFLWGRAVLIEIKVPPDLLSAIQGHFIDRHNKMLGLAFTADSATDAIAIIGQAICDKHPIFGGFDLSWLQHNWMQRLRVMEGRMEDSESKIEIVRAMPAGLTGGRKEGRKPN